MRYLLLNKDAVWLEFRCERNEYLEVLKKQAVLYNISDDNFYFLDFHKWNSRCNPSHGTLYSFACDSSHKSGAVPELPQTHNPE